MTDPIATLASRLAIPEREPDEAFVFRVDRMIDIQAAEQVAFKARKEQLAFEILGAIALFFCARQLIAIGGDAAALLQPLVSGGGGIALLAGTMLLLFTAVSGEREGYA